MEPTGTVEYSLSPLRYCMEYSCTKPKMKLEKKKKRIFFLLFFSKMSLMERGKYT